MAINDFKNRFVYDAARTGYVGVERECFITEGGVVVPRAHEVLTALARGFDAYDNATTWQALRTVRLQPIAGAFGYELSACQIETRVGPCLIDTIGDQLLERAYQLDLALQHFGLSALHTEVGPADMPLDVYPDPTGRYQKITANMPRSILEAACRVIGTHVHVGMRDHSMALRVYNHATNHHEELCELGNGSFGERMQLYRKMAPNSQSYRFHSWEMFHKHAVRKGFEEDPRKCWTLIRISVHGTIEFRMFGATSSLERIESWAHRCHEICTEVM